MNEIIVILTYDGFINKEFVLLLFNKIGNQLEISNENVERFIVVIVEFNFIIVS